MTNQMIWQFRSKIQNKNAKLLRPIASEYVICDQTKTNHSPRSNKVFPKQTNSNVPNRQPKVDNE